MQLIIAWGGEKGWAAMAAVPFFHIGYRLIFALTFIRSSSLSTFRHVSQITRSLAPISEVSHCLTQEFIACSNSPLSISSSPCIVALTSVCLIWIIRTRSKLELSTTHISTSPFKYCALSRKLSAFAVRDCKCLVIDREPWYC